MGDLRHEHPRGRRRRGQSNFLIPNGTFFFVLLIFLIVLGVIAKWVVPPISKVLHEREEMVHKTVEDNRRAAAATGRRGCRLPQGDGEAAVRRQTFATRPAPRGARSSTRRGPGQR